MPEPHDGWLRLIAVAHILTALGIGLFWLGFYTELTFPMDALRAQLPHFEAYYVWESSFTVPDLLTAAAMLWGAGKLLRDPHHAGGRLALTVASGGLMFLGVLDFVYGVRAGMFNLDPTLTLMLVMIAVSVAPLGALTVYVLHLRRGAS